MERELRNLEKKYQSIIGEVPLDYQKELKSIMDKHQIEPLHMVTHKK